MEVSRDPHYLRTLGGLLPALAHPRPTSNGESPSPQSSEALLAVPGFSAHLRCPLPKPYIPSTGPRTRRPRFPFAPHRDELRQNTTAAVTGLVHWKQHWLSSGRSRTQSPQRALRLHSGSCSWVPAARKQAERRRPSQLFPQLGKLRHGQTHQQLPGKATSPSSTTSMEGPQLLLLSLPGTVISLRTGPGGCLPDWAQERLHREQAKEPRTAF